jgi:hypothetical protein
MLHGVLKIDLLDGLVAFYRFGLGQQTPSKPCRHPPVPTNSGSQPQLLPCSLDGCKNTRNGYATGLVKQTQQESMVSKYDVLLGLNLSPVRRTRMRQRTALPLRRAKAIMMHFLPIFQLYCMFFLQYCIPWCGTGEHCERTQHMGQHADDNVSGERIIIEAFPERGKKRNSWEASRIKGAFVFLTSVYCEL